MAAISFSVFAVSFQSFVHLAILLNDLTGTWSLNKEWVYLNKNKDSQNMHLKFISYFKFLRHFKCLASYLVNVLYFCYTFVHHYSISESEVTSKNWKFYINSNCFFHIKEKEM